MTINAALPHELVSDPDYFRDVMRNMGWIASKDHRRVRFGLTGDGHSPNYQVEWPSDHPEAGKVRRFSGRSHNAFHDAPLTTFDPERLTQPFTWEEVQGMLKQALARKGKSV